MQTEMYQNTIMLIRRIVTHAIEAETEIERMRVTVSKLMYNRLREAYEVIDYMKRGQITAVEILRFLDMNPIPSD